MVCIISKLPREYHRGTPEARYTARVIRTRDPDACWGWHGSTDRKGYGRLGLGTFGNTRVMLAHRLSWEIHFGPIPDGLCVLHRCDNPPCSNPRHLFLGTRVHNNADMRAKGRESTTGHFSSERFAKKGHPRAKLTREQVDAIRSEYVPRRVTVRDLATRYNVSRSTIKAVLSRQNWR